MSVVVTCRGEEDRLYKGCIKIPDLAGKCRADCCICGANININN